MIFDFSSSPSGDGGHDSEYGSDLDDEDDDGDNDYCDGDDEKETFIAMMIVFALSSAPCFELFSAAPAENNFKLQKRFQTLSFQKGNRGRFLTLLLFTNRGSRIYIVI